MGRVTMDGRERMQRMFARREQDRVPRFESFWGDTITRWQGEGLRGGGDRVREMLGCDIQELCWFWLSPFPGQWELVREDEQTRVIRDGHGKLLRSWKHRNGTPEHLGFECDTRQAWESKFKPALLETGLQVDPEAVKRNYRKCRQNGRWGCLVTVESFEQTRALMGDEITLMAMIEDPEWVRDVSQTFVTQAIRNLDACMATGIEPDGLWIYGDMAFKTATMCSPAMYKELIWPDHKRLADWAHAHNLKFIYHTDGNINGVMELYRQAGFDCLQPLESKAGMDVRQLIPRYGRELAFFGNIDVMVMASNMIERIEAEIASKFAAGKESRGYVYHSDHSVPPSVSWKTYQRIIELVDKYGWYE